MVVPRAQTAPRTVHFLPMLLTCAFHTSSLMPGKDNLTGPPLSSLVLCLSSSNPLASKLCTVLTDEAFEFYCSQCHKQINRLEDLSARLTDLEMNR